MTNYKTKKDGIIVYADSHNDGYLVRFYGSKFLVPKDVFELCFEQMKEGEFSHPCAYFGPGHYGESKECSQCSCSFKEKSGQDWRTCGYGCRMYNRVEYTLELDYNSEVAVTESVEVCQVEWDRWYYS